MIVAIIPARGGSKRIKKKNIKNFLGKPIISYPIKEAIKAKIFDKIIVSTDSNQIMKISKKYGAKILFRRPKNLSGDKIGTREVVSHAINWLDKNLKKPKIICCIYPTSPLIKAKDLISSFKKIKNSRWNYVIGATRFSYPIQRAFFKSKNGGIKMVNQKNFHKRSQDFRETFHDAGQFCWGKFNAWNSKKIILEKNSTFYLMSKLKVQDIDNLEDWKNAEKLYRLNYEK